MKKVPGVAQVRVSLKEGLTVLDLKADNTVTLAKLRQVVKNNGFVSKEAKVIARGTVAPDQKTFTVSGTQEQLAVVASPQPAGEAWEFTSPP
jgi:copper chaperone CopZ